MLKVFRSPPSAGPDREARVFTLNFRQRLSLPSAAKFARIHSKMPLPIPRSNFC
jgi:hypothetical protein